MISIEDLQVTIPKHETRGTVFGPNRIIVCPGDIVTLTREEMAQFKIDTKSPQGALISCPGCNTFVIIRDGQNS